MNNRIDGLRCQGVGTSISGAGRRSHPSCGPPVASGQLHSRHDSIERAVTLATPHAWLNRRPLTRSSDKMRRPTHSIKSFHEAFRAKASWAFPVRRISCCCMCLWLLRQLVFRIVVVQVEDELRKQTRRTEPTTEPVFTPTRPSLRALQVLVALRHSLAYGGGIVNQCC
jgi:hypothetical protein